MEVLRVVIEEESEAMAVLKLVVVTVSRDELRDEMEEAVDEASAVIALVSGLTAGHAVKADVNKLKPGMLVGKALGECRKDRGIIPVILTLS